MQKSRFFKGLTWLLLLNFLIKPVWIFFIDREVQNTVGHEVYGSYFALFNLTYVLLFLADGGLTNMMVQQVAGTSSTNTQQLLKVKLLLLLLYALLCCFIGWLSAVSSWQLFVYLIMVQALGSFLLFLRGLLAANQLYKTDAKASVADKSLMILSCSLFLYGWWQPITLVTFLQLQLASLAIVTLLLILSLLRKKLLSSGETEKVGLILRRILPFAAIILLMGAHYRLDGFLLERIRVDGRLQAGIYATAYRLLDTANMIGYLTASFLVPFLVRNKNNKHLMTSVVQTSENTLVAIAIAVSCFAVVFAFWIQTILYQTNDSVITKTIQLCLAVLPAYFLTHIYGSVLTALNGLRTFIFILSFSVLTNVFFNLLLIPGNGALGCCMAALISQYGCAFACYYVAKRKLSFSGEWRRWAIYIFAAALLLLLLFFLQSVIHSVWIILAIISIVLLLTALTLLKPLKLFMRSFIH